jgi:hypothetical protein
MEASKNMMRIALVRFGLGAHSNRPELPFGVELEKLYHGG